MTDKFKRQFIKAAEKAGLSVVKTSVSPTNQDLYLDKAKRLGLFGLSLFDLIDEIEKLRLIRDEVGILVESAREDGMKNEMFLNSFDRLEALLYPGRFSAPPQKEFGKNK